MTDVLSGVGEINVLKGEELIVNIKRDDPETPIIVKDGYAVALVPDEEDKRND